MMAGGAISWCHRKQSVLATSTCEAEYMSLSAACKEDFWLRGLQMEVINRYRMGSTINSDSQSVIKLAGSEGINH